MRLLIFHVDEFTCTITRKGRSGLVETPTSRAAHIDAGLLALIAVEVDDGDAVAQVAEGAAAEIVKLATQLKVHDVMLLPFAHLFVEPGPAEQAVEIIDYAAARLRLDGLDVQRAPFGWFHSWEMRAKGHPLSRVARTIRPSEASHTVA